MSKDEVHEVCVAPPGTLSKKDEGYERNGWKLWVRAHVACVRRAKPNLPAVCVQHAIFHDDKHLPIWEDTIATSSEGTKPARKHATPCECTADRLRVARD